jgi:hypothetical protein
MRDFFEREPTTTTTTKARKYPDPFFGPLRAVTFS